MERSREQELIACLKEMRDACAAAMRILAKQNTATLLDEFESELQLIGIPIGFGKRADDLIKKCEGQ